MSKASSHLPTGFHTVTVHLTVTGAAAYIDFLKQAFDAVELTRSTWPDGRLLNAIDVLRRERTARTFAPELGRLLESEWTLAPKLSGPSHAG